MSANELTQVHALQNFHKLRNAARATDRGLLLPRTGLPLFNEEGVEASVAVLGLLGRDDICIVPRSALDCESSLAWCTLIHVGLRCNELLCKVVSLLRQLINLYFHLSDELL